MWMECSQNFLIRASHKWSLIYFLIESLLSSGTSESLLSAFLSASLSSRLSLGWPIKLSSQYSRAFQASGSKIFLTLPTHPTHPHKPITFCNIVGVTRRAFLEGWKRGDVEIILEPYLVLQLSPTVQKSGQFCLSSPLPFWSAALKRGEMQTWHKIYPHKWMCDSPKSNEIALSKIWLINGQIRMCNLRIHPTQDLMFPHL